MKVTDISKHGNLIQHILYYIILIYASFFREWHEETCDSNTTNWMGRGNIFYCQYNMNTKATRRIFDLSSLHPTMVTVANIKLCRKTGPLSSNKCQWYALYGILQLQQYALHEHWKYTWHLHKCVLLQSIFPVFFCAQKWELTSEKAIIPLSLWFFHP